MPQVNTGELSRTAELLLVRLLPVGGRSGPGPKKVRDELRALGAQVASDEAWDGLVEDLRGAGLLAQERGLKLTDAGRARGLAVLGISALPPTATWPMLRDRYLVALATGGGADADLRSKGKLAAHVLKGRFGLDVPDGSPLGATVAALVCKELGFPGLSDFKSLQAAVLGQVLKAPGPLPPDDAVEQFVRAQFGLRRGQVGELRQSVIREWVADEQSRNGAPAGVVEKSKGDAVGQGGDLAAFAAAARAAAAASPTGWFGDNKVFIAHAWRQYRAGDDGAALDLPGFKARLVEANRAGLLTLSRADLVAAMDPADIRESATRHLNAEFHFILVDRKG